MRETGNSAVTTDVAIVGAGPAGLAAAASAAEAGASVLVIDSAEQPGGQYWRHRSETAGPDGGSLHHGWHEYLALRQRFDAGIASGTIRHLPATSVWMVHRRAPQALPDATVAAVSGSGSGTSTSTGFTLRLAPAYGPGTSPVPTVHARTLVLATGGYDRQIPVPGWQLPGVMAAGGIQAFAKQNGTLPGSRFIIAGTGPFLLPVASNIVHSGGSVAAVLESSSLAGWLPRAHRALGVPAKGVEGAEYVATFLRHRIPYRPRTVITEILGDGRVEAVRIARVARDGSLRPGSQRIIEGIDAVGLGWGFTPQLELPVQLGVETRVDTDGSLNAVVDEDQRSSVPGLLLAGELTGVGGAALAVLEGGVAGRIAAGDAVGAPGSSISSASPAERRAMARQRAFAEAMHLAHPVPTGWEHRLHDDTVVCRCEEVRYGALAHAREQLAGEDSRTQKGVTRAGMGWCQGRVCGYAVSCIASAETGEDTKSSLDQSTKRPIAQPLPLAALLDLAPDPTPPLAPAPPPRGTSRARKWS